MNPTRFAQSNVIIRGNGQDILDVHGACIIYPDNIPAWVTAWQPTPEELVKINLGHPIFLSLIGEAMQPALVMVKNPCEDTTPETLPINPVIQ